MRAPPAFRLLALALGREVSTVDWPFEGLIHEGPRRGIPRIDRDGCTRCGACVQVCPSGCLEMPEKRGPPVLDIGPCVRCRACVSACEEDAVTMDDPSDQVAYERADLIQDGSPMTEVEVVRAPSRMYRTATDQGKRTLVEPEEILRIRKERLDRR